MKIKALLGLTAIGAYIAHRRRGGTMTLESVKESLNALRDTVMGGVDKLKSSAMPEKEPMKRNGYSGAYDADVIEPQH